MNAKKDFENLYLNVSKSIAKAMDNITQLNIENKEGKKKLGNMVNRLKNIQSKFDGELNMLDKNAEWDRFTMAFFGETNAGKSTIIDSLRILFKEESRQQILKNKSHDLDVFEQNLTKRSSFWRVNP